MVWNVRKTTWVGEIKKNFFCHPNMFRPTFCNQFLMVKPCSAMDDPRGIIFKDL